MLALCQIGWVEVITLLLARKLSFDQALSSTPTLRDVGPHRRTLAWRPGSCAAPAEPPPAHPLSSWQRPASVQPLLLQAMRVGKEVCTAAARERLYSASRYGTDIVESIMRVVAIEADSQGTCFSQAD